MNTKALDAYMDACLQAQELVDQITLYLYDHGEVLPRDVTYTNVAGMRRVVDDLSTVAKYISDRQQHAREENEAAIANTWLYPW